MCVRCVYGDFGREITKYMVIYSVCRIVQFGVQSKSSGLQTFTHFNKI